MAKWHMLWKYQRVFKPDSNETLYITWDVSYQNLEDTQTPALNEAIGLLCMFASSPEDYYTIATWHIYIEQGRRGRAAQPSISSEYTPGAGTRPKLRKFTASSSMLATPPCSRSCMAWTPALPDLCDFRKLGATKTNSLIAHSKIH